MDSAVTPLMSSGCSLSTPSSLSALSYSRCATCTVGVLVGWPPLNFCRGRKLIDLGLLLLATVWLWDGSIASSFWAYLHCLEIIRMDFLISTGLEGGYHCFELLRHPTTEVVTLQFSHMIQWIAFGECCHENLDVSQEMHPHSDTISFSPICSLKSSWFWASRAFTLF